ncbi:MAG TPA: hypothetical protein VHR86_05125, partial [Armatimonadota bacterium]|nr:hypothetical protein [Armatimonadota bacterium]
WNDLQKQVPVPDALKKPAGTSVSMLEAQWLAYAKYRYSPAELDAGEYGIQQTLATYLNVRANAGWMDSNSLSIIFEQSPRSPYFARIYRLVCAEEKRPRDLYAYASVLCQLCPQQPYWKDLQAAAKAQGGEWAPDAKTIAQELAAKPTPAPATFAPGQVITAKDLPKPDPFKPLLLEFLFYRAAQLGDADTIDLVMNKYLDSLKRQAPASILKIHIWDFVRQIAPSLPEKQRQTLLTRTRNIQRFYER